MPGAALRAIGLTTGPTGALVAVGDDGYAARSTDNGVTWSEILIGSGAPDLVGCAGSPGLGEFLVVRSDATTTAYASSNDGQSWATYTLPSATARQACFYFTGLGFLILQGTGISWNGANYVSGSVFVNATGPGANTLRGATYYDGTLYVCGDAGLLARTATAAGSASPTWEVLTSGTVDDLFAIEVDPDGVFAAVGESGRVITSSDGTTWTVATNPDTSTLYGVQHDGVNRWTAVGALRQSMESYQGLYNHGTLTLTTAWLKPDTKWGRVRLWNVVLVAKHLGPHGVQIDIGYDYESAWSDTYTFTGDEIDALAEVGETYELRVGPRRQQASAYRFRVTELSPAEYTYGLQPVSLVLELGVRPGGVAKVPLARKR